MDDDIDFDDLLAEAEQEGEMYADYVDDIEAEMAMEAEESARTPKGNAASGNFSNVPRGVGVEPPPPSPPLNGLYDAARADGLVASASSLRSLIPSPVSLDQRLGVSPLECSPSGGGDSGRGGIGDGCGEAMRALNSEGLSPLHPVLKDSTNGISRWSDRRLPAADGGMGGGGRGAAGRGSRGSRSQEASSGSGSMPFMAWRLDTPKRAVDTKGAVLSRPSLDGDSIPFMQSGGRMMHLKLRALATSSAPFTSGSEFGTIEDPAGRPPPRNLLRVPMETLMERVNERRVMERSIATAAVERAVAAAMEEDEETKERDSHFGGDGGVEAGGGGGGDSSSGGGGSGDGRGGNAREAGALWVDKYAPDGFRDLLSDEKINREVLRAVKAWDPFVFKKEPTKSNDAAAAAAAAKKPGWQVKDSSGDSADKRPDARVIMLCGPPGLGKTTLAQVVARHAGYRVYEINASDDRTAPVLKQRITEAMEGNTLLADKRPNLIVLDEVDGADGKAAAQVLVDIVSAPLARASGANGGKKTKRKALTRPLVLICNDQWTPALRPIRALAQVFVFRPKASPARLVQRLKAICATERLCVNTDALTRLADRSHLDVRSCLNTLQFIARRAATGGVRNASAALLTAVAEGVKDERRDLFEVLRSVFTRKRSGTKRRLFVGGEQGSAGVYVADGKQADVFEEVQAFNDHGKVLSGVHESFLGVRFNDPTLCKAAAAIDWLEMADLMDARTNRTQDYSFSRYAPLAAAGVHFLCRSDQRAVVSQPKKDYEVRTARAAKSNILHSFADGRQLGATGRTTQAIVLDMLSHLMDILAPTLRPLNPDLLSPQERARFRELVGILFSCGLTFAPQSAAIVSGGSSFPRAMTQEFSLEPAIDQLLKYDGYDLAHPMLAGPLRPMVAHEVNLEIMRRAEATNTDRTNAGEPPSSSTPVKGGDDERISPKNERSSVPANQPKLFPSVKPSSRNSAGRKLDGADEGAAKSDVSQTAAAADTGREKAPTVPASSTSPKKAIRDRPAYVVPFWNRTNWISGREDGTGSRGGSGKGGSGSGKDSPKDGNLSTKRPMSEMSGTAKNSAEAGNAAPNTARESGSAPCSSVPGEGMGGTESKRSRPEARVRYQFRAGYTNAVRRPVRMRDLM